MLEDRITRAVVHVGRFTSIVVPRTVGLLRQLDRQGALMHVAIDMKHMRFTHKHANSQIAWLLAGLETHTPMLFGDASEPSFFNGLDNVQMIRLYCNTTGKPAEDVSTIGLSMRSLLREIATRLPTTDANLAELEQQCESVKDDPDGFYAYQRGAVVPKEMPEDWEPPTLLAHAHSKDLEKDVIAIGKKDQDAHEAKIQADAAAARAHPDWPFGVKKAGSAPREPRAPGSTAPRTGGVRDVIWKAADEMWTAAGSPKEIATVLKLRKEMMNKLEEQGVKRTTSSSELGNWQKARLV